MSFAPRDRATARPFGRATARPLRRADLAIVITALVTLVTMLSPLTTQAASTKYRLLVSSSPARTNASSLDRRTIGGDEFVFTNPDTNVVSVRFWLDDTTMAGDPDRVELAARYDFAGTLDDGTPLPWRTGDLADGTHTITARITTTKTQLTVTSRFSIDNGEPSPTATPSVLPTVAPSAQPTAAPTATPPPTPIPTAAPTATPQPSVLPTVAPTPSPTAAPTAAPTATATPPAGTIVPASPGALAAAIAAAPNGATLILRGGEHVNNFISTGKSLTIKAYPGEVPVITHPTRRPDLLYFTGGPVLVQGITFKMGVNAPTFDDSMGSALSEVLSGGHDVTYDGCTFIGNANASGRQQLLYLGAGAGKVTVKNSTFDYNGGDGSGVHAYHDPGGNLIVDHNVFRDFGYEAAVLIDQTGSGKVITANTFYDANIAIQHVKSDGTSITSNTGYRVGTGIDIRSSSNLSTSGNVWNP